MIAIGWNKIKNLRKIHVKAALEALHKKAYPRETKGAQAINIGQAWAFCKEMEKGDIILTPNPLTRTIYIGRVKSDYLYHRRPLGEMDYAHRRKVTWEKEVSRDVFSLDLRHSIGSLMTLFNIDKHADEIEAVLAGKIGGIAAKSRIAFPKKLKEEVSIGGNCFAHKMLHRRRREEVQK